MCTRITATLKGPLQDARRARAKTCECWELQHDIKQLASCMDTVHRLWVTLSVDGKEFNKTAFVMNNSPLPAKGNKSGGCILRGTITFGSVITSIDGCGLDLHLVTWSSRKWVRLDSWACCRIDWTVINASSVLPRHDRDINNSGSIPTSNCHNTTGAAAKRTTITARATRTTTTATTSQLS